MKPQKQVYSLSLKRRHNLKTFENNYNLQNHFRSGEQVTCSLCSPVNVNTWMCLRSSLPSQCYWWEKENPCDNIYSLHHIEYFSVTSTYMTSFDLHDLPVIDWKNGPDFPVFCVSMPFAKNLRSCFHQEVESIFLGSGLRCDLLWPVEYETLC